MNERAQLLRDGYLKWSLPQLNPARKQLLEWMIQYDLTGRFGLDPEGRSRLDATMAQAAARKMEKLDVGFLLVKIPESNDAFISWCMLPHEAGDRASTLPLVGWTPNVRARHGELLNRVEQDAILSLQGRPSAPTDPLEAEWTRLAGRWQGVAVAGHVHALERNPAGDHGLVADAATKTITLLLKGRGNPAKIVLVPTSTPKQIDFTSEAGFLSEGIYKLDGDDLTICLADTGKPRPQAFHTDTNNGGGGSMIVFRRVNSEGANDQALTISMNEEFGLLFQGRLVAPAELGRVLEEALKENPDREIAIDLPKRPWTVVGHVDQLAQIARIAGAKQVIRPKWADQPEPVRQFVGHTNMVKSVAFSPDGKMIASASGFPLGDNTVRIWDRDSGAVLHELDLHRIPVVFVAFSPDGQRLLSGDAQGHFFLWDPQSGRRLKNWRNNGIMIDEVAFTPDGEQIVFLKNDASAANEAVQELEKTPQTDVDLEALKLRMESLVKRTIQVVNATDGTVVKSIPLDATASPGVAVTPDGRHVVVPMYDGTVRMLELTTGQETRRFAAPATDPPTQPVMAFAAAVSPNGEKLAAGYLNRTVRVWNLNTGEMLREIRTPSSAAGRIAFFADNRRLAVAGPVLQAAPNTPAVSVLDVETGALLAQTPAILNRALGDGFAFALAPDEQHILTAGGGYYDNQSRKWKGTGDYALRLWRLSDLGEIDTNKLPPKPE